MFINRRFPYQPLDRTTAEDGTRFYVQPDNGKPLPSVTTVLGATADKTFLKEWQDRVGLKKADEIRDEAAALGTLMHTHLECYVEGQERPRGNNVIRQLAERMSNTIIREGLSQVDEVWGQEIGLYFPDLYAGTSDLIGVFQGRPAIIDYKNTRKMKTKEMITDYFCQGAAYALAHNYLYETDIQSVVIFMCARDLQYQTYEVTGGEFERYADMWMNRLLTFEQKGGAQG